MDSLEPYKSFISQHMEGCRGERKRRLVEHGHAERMFLVKVWFPLFGHFIHLYPEFEVDDFKDGHRFLDFAYIRGPYRICIEIDPYGTHGRDLNRWQHDDNLARQNDLIIDGWLVLRFSLDDIMERPRRCQQKIQQLIGRLYGAGEELQLTPDENEIIRFVAKLDSEVTVKMVVEHLRLSDRTCRKRLQGLIKHNILVASGTGKQRIRLYKINKTNQHFNHI